jgi:hypothetical protein
VCSIISLPAVRLYDGITARASETSRKSQAGLSTYTITRPYKELMLSLLSFSLVNKMSEIHNVSRNYCEIIKRPYPSKCQILLPSSFFIPPLLLTFSFVINYYEYRHKNA